MEINISTLITKEDMTNGFDKVKTIIKEFGFAIVVDNDKPSYIVKDFIQTSTEIKRAKVDLWKAMRIVLREAPNQTMHAKDIAIEIDKRGLYYMKDGESVKATQIRARAGNRPEEYECLSGNMIKLRESLEDKN